MENVSIEMFNSIASQFLHDSNEASDSTMIRYNSLILFCFFSYLVAKQSTEPIFDNPFDLQDNSDMEFELNALRRTIPGEPGQ